MIKLFTLLLITLPAFGVFAQLSNTANQKINNTNGNLGPILSNEDQFGNAVELIGDLNGDGVDDIAVGANGVDDGQPNSGAVFILFMNSDNTVSSHQKISNTSGNLQANLNNDDRFGASLGFLGDINGDGKIELAVGAQRDDQAGNEAGAVYILSLNTDGTVASEYKLTEGTAGFTGNLDISGTFGSDIENIGDLNGDGYDDIAVGNRRDNDGGTRVGALWILFLNGSGTVIDHQKISPTQGNFNVSLDTEDYFGSSIVNLGDLNNDGNVDLAVGAYRDDDGGTDYGALYILFLNNNGTVNDYEKISTTNYPTLNLNDDALFTISMSSCEDIDNDGNEDLLIGAMGLDGTSSFEGGYYFLMLNNDGTVKEHQKIAKGLAGFNPALSSDDYLSRGITYLGKINNTHKVAAGAFYDSENGYRQGSVWISEFKGSFGEPSDIIKHDENVSFSVFPNPFSEVLKITSEDKEIESMYLIDNSGKLVKELTSYKFQEQIDLSDIERGIYHLIINTKNASEIKKLVKQ